MRLPPLDDFATAYNEICRTAGVVLPVSPDFYRFFIGMGDEVMREALRLLIKDRADEFKRWASAQPRVKTDADMRRSINTMLRLYAVGCLQFYKDGSLGCFAPRGPAPTPSENAAIDKRIDASQEQIRATLREIIGEGR